MDILLLKKQFILDYFKNAASQTSGPPILTNNVSFNAHSACTN